MEITVVIPTVGSPGTVSFCIESVLTQKTSRSYEVIVADGGGDSGTEAIMRRFPIVRYFKWKNAGIGAARMHGAAQGRGEIVLFTDDDCIAEEDWIDRMIEPFADPRVVGVKGVRTSTQTEPVAIFAQVEREELYDSLAKRESIGFANTYSAGFRKKVFLENGSFDKKTGILTIKPPATKGLSAGNVQVILFNRKAKVYQSHPSTLGSYLRRKTKEGYMKHAERKRKKGMRKEHPFSPRQKLQIGSLVLFMASIVLFASYRAAVWAPAIGGILLTASIIPPSVRAMKKDFSAGIRAPFFAVSASAALLIGFGAGLVMSALSRKS